MQLKGLIHSIIIDKPIMELLNIDSDTQLEIATDGQNIIISPVHDSNKMKKLEKALVNINKKHESTLRKLAK